MSAASGGAEPPVEQLQAEVETLKKEVEKLRKNGTDVVEAYNRKKERADELLETLVALKQEYEEMTHKVEAMEQESSEAARMLRVQEEELERLRGLVEPAEGASGEAIHLASRLPPTSSGLSEAAVAGALAEVGRRHENLMNIVDAAVQLVEQSVRASSTNRGQMGPADATWHITRDPRVEIGAVMGLLVERTCERAESWVLVQAMADEKRQAEEVWRSCEESWQECRKSLMHDLTCLQDFATLEREVLQEEGEGLGHKIESLTVQLEGSQAVAEDMRAQALEQAERDARTIQELEVTVQLTEGALKLSEELPPREDQDSLESLRAKLAETEEELASTRRAVSLLEEKLQGMPALEEKVRGMADLEARVKDVERLEEKVKALGEREDRLREGGAAAGLPVTAVRGTAEPASEDCMADLQRLRAEVGEVRRERDRAQANYSLLQQYVASRRMVLPVTGVGNEGPAGAVGLLGGAGGRGVGMNGVAMASKGLLMPNQPSQVGARAAVGEVAPRRPEEAAN